MSKIPTSNQRKGQRGEEIAAAFLTQHGYTILTRNWRCTGELGGELDIIAHEGNDLVGIEVRARSDSLDAALESLTPRKLARLMHLITQYGEAHDLPSASLRIDVVAVCFATQPPSIEVLQNAVGW